MTAAALRYVRARARPQFVRTPSWRRGDAVDRFSLREPRPKRWSTSTTQAPNAGMGNRGVLTDAGNGNSLLAIPAPRTNRYSSSGGSGGSASSTSGGIVGSGAPIGQRPFTAAAMAAASASLAAIVAARSVVTVSAGTVCAATRCTWR